MNFIAIDFETANEKRNSPCSIGIVKVENSKIVEKVNYLIKPKDMRFEPMNIWIHGIRPSMVENEKEFSELWEDIKHYFNKNLVVAHNASFDISVLRRTLELYGIEIPNFNYICTMKLSKNFYKGLDNAKLNTVSSFLDFKFNHHDALDDSLACANILLEISKEIDSNDIEEISNLVGVTIGNVNSKGYTPSSTKGKIYRTSNRIFNLSKVDKINVVENSFENEVVVFTGGLRGFSREEAIKLVRLGGGSTGSSVTRKTTILVSGIKNIDLLKREEMSNKLKKAHELIESGQGIKILSEEDFFMRLEGF